MCGAVGRFLTAGEPDMLLHSSQEYLKLLQVILQIEI